MAFPLERTFIVDKHLGLSAEKPPIPDFVRRVAEENEMLEKPEVHISVLVTKNALLLWKAVASTNTQAEKIETLFKSYVWEYSPLDEYLLHERRYSRSDLSANGYDAGIPEHTRRTVVQKVTLSDLAEFYEKVNRMLGTDLSVPIPHVTLFAWSDYEPFKTRGIGINSAEEFKRFTKAEIKA